MPELSIIIPTLNGVENLGPCLDSIRSCTSVPHEVIVYANECDAATGAFLDGRPDVSSIRSRENRYFTQAVNEGIAASKGEFIFLLNDDTVLLRDDWYAFYRAQLELDSRIAVVGPYWKNIDELPHGWIEPYATLYRRESLDAFGGLPYYDDSFVLWWSDIYHAYALMRDGHLLRPLDRSVVDQFVFHRREGESGETVLALRPQLPRECFHFHGKDTMYRRLGIRSDEDLVGYYGGEVAGRAGAGNLLARAATA